MFDERKKHIVRRCGALFLSLSLVLQLAACGSSDGSSAAVSSEGSSDSSSTIAEESTAESIAESAEESITERFTVKFDMNGADDPESQTVISGSTVNLPPAPVKKGYLFDKWYSDKDCTAAFDLLAPVTSDITLYAGWISVTRDDDNDGVPYVVENVLGTSDNSADSDGDGIPDYTEIYETGSDPARPDSGKDSDGDGISNLDEFNVYKTHSGKADTDGDGLKDYDELFVYKTDPLKKDTDGDGVNDGGEITLGTDPLDSDDISPVQQTLRKKYYDPVLFEKNAAVPSISGKAAYVLNDSVTVKWSGKIPANSVVVGKGLFIDMPSVSELDLSFRCGSSANNLAVMELTGDGFALMDSEKDGNTITVQIDHGGDYCVVNIPALLELFGINADELARLVSEWSRYEPRERADNIILLSDYQLVTLKAPPTSGSSDTDGDGLSDIDELGYPFSKDIGDVLKAVLAAKGVDGKMSDSYFTYYGAPRIKIYPYISNPTLTDTDFDGIPDGAMKAADGIVRKADPAPADPVQRGEIVDDDTGYNYSGALYSPDFRDIGSFSRDMAMTSLVFSNTIYYSGGFAFDNGSRIMDITELMRYHGFENVIDYKLKDGCSDVGFTADAYEDDDLTEVCIGCKTVVYGGKAEKIIGIVVRGTNSSVEEWSSNFDLGDPEEWELPYHRGFYTAAERVREFVERYASFHRISGSGVTYWITGHSRGAGISGILAARLIDSGKNVIAYTFAGPAVTLRSDCRDEKYSSIYNFVNVEDVVTSIPFLKWSYSRFGNDIRFDLSDEELLDKWMENTGRSGYSAFGESLIRAFESSACEHLGTTREEIYRISEKDRIVINEKKTGLISDRAKKYCRVEKTAGNLYYLFPSTAFILQLTAEIISLSEPDSANARELISEFWYTKYLKAVMSFIGGSIADIYDEFYVKEKDIASAITDGHVPATYYVYLAECCPEL